MAIDPRQAMMQGAMAMNNSPIEQGDNTPEERAGRGGDTLLGHLTPGEIVIPKDLLNGTNQKNINAMFDRAGLDINQYTVGHENNSVNPETGNPEFGFFDDVFSGDPFGTKRKAEKKGREAARHEANIQRKRIKQMMAKFNKRIAKEKRTLLKESKLQKAKSKGEFLVAERSFKERMSQIEKEQAGLGISPGAVEGSDPRKTGDKGKFSGRSYRKRRNRVKRLMNRRPL